MQGMYFELLGSADEAEALYKKELERDPNSPLILKRMVSAGMARPAAGGGDGFTRAWGRGHDGGAQCPSAWRPGSSACWHHPRGAAAPAARCRRSLQVCKNAEKTSGLVVRPLPQVGLRRGQGDLPGAAELLKQYLAVQVGGKGAGQPRVAFPLCPCAMPCGPCTASSVLLRPHVAPSTCRAGRAPRCVQGTQDWQAWEEAADLYLQMQVWG